MKALKNILKTISNNRISASTNISRGGILLGSIGDKYYINGDDTHTIVIGATRSGKTRRVVLQTIGILGLAGESMVISDPKGELHQYTYPFLERLGYNVYVLDFKNPERSDHYNFLQEVIDAINEDDIPRAQKKALEVTEALVGNDMSNEKIWTEGEKSILTACILAVVYDNKKHPEYQNLTNVYYFINEMCEMSDNPPLKRYIDNISIENPNHPALALISSTKVAPSKTQGSFNISALATLRLFSDINVYNITSRNSFRLSEIGEKKTAVFIILPDNNTTYYGVASLLVDQIYNKLADVADLRGGRLERRVNFILDEFGNFAVIPDFAAKLTVGGGRGMRFNLFVQSIAQIESDTKKTKYGKEGARIITGNCEYWIYISSRDNETQKTISEMIGDYTVMSNSMSNSYNGTRLLDWDGGHISASGNLIGRRLLKPEEISQIKAPHVLVVANRSVIMNAYDLSKTPFNKMFGLGDKEHNRKVREERYARRIPDKINAVVALWGIWNEYKRVPIIKRPLQFNKSGIDAGEKIFKE